jgi:hypothetical protein
MWRVWRRLHCCRVKARLYGGLALTFAAPAPWPRVMRRLNPADFTTADSCVFKRPGLVSFMRRRILLGLLIGLVVACRL